MFGTRLNRYSRDWDPWRDFRHLHRDMHRLFGQRSGWTAREYPAVNLWRGDEDVVLTAEIPGVQADDLDISVQGDTVTLRGSRKVVALQEGETYHRQERGSGNFVRAVQLPFEADADKVDASLEKGILNLRLPQAEVDKPKKIEVKTA